ncbi:MAG: hypothetical protein QXD03_05140, partial [Candidatus Anstonellales archaeon]
TIDKNLIVYDTGQDKIISVSVNDKDVLGDTFGIDLSSGGISLINKKGVDYILFNADGSLVKQEDYDKVVLLGAISDGYYRRYLVYAECKLQYLKLDVIVDILNNGFKAVNFIVKTINDKKVISLLKGSLKDIELNSRYTRLSVEYDLMDLGDVRYSIDGTILNITKNLDIAEVPIGFNCSSLIIRVGKDVKIGKLVLKDLGGIISTIRIINIDNVRDEVNLCLNCRYILVSNSLKDIPKVVCNKNSSIYLIQQGNGMLQVDKDVINRIEGLNEIDLFLDNRYDEIRINTNGMKSLLKVEGVSEVRSYLVELKGDRPIHFTVKNLICQVFDMKDLLGNLYLKVNNLVATLIRMSKNKNNNFIDSINPNYTECIIVPNVVDSINWNDILTVSYNRGYSKNAVVIHTEDEEERWFRRYYTDKETSEIILKKLALIGMDVDDSILNTSIYYRNINKIVKIMRSLKGVSIGDVFIDKIDSLKGFDVSDIDNCSDEEVVRFKLLFNAIVRNFRYVDEVSKYEEINSDILYAVKLNNEYEIRCYMYGGFGLVKIYINKSEIYRTVINTSLIKNLKESCIDASLYALENELRKRIYDNDLYRLDGCYIPSSLALDIIDRVVFKNSMTIYNGGSIYIYNITTGRYLVDTGNIIKIVDGDKFKGLVNNSIDDNITRLSAIGNKEIYRELDISSLVVLQKAVCDDFDKNIEKILKMYYKYVTFEELYKAVPDVDVIRGNQVWEYVSKYNDLRVVIYECKSINYGGFMDIKYVVQVIDLCTNKNRGVYYGTNTLEEVYREIINLDLGLNGVDLNVSNRFYDRQLIDNNFILIGIVPYKNMNLGMFISKLDGKGYIMDIRDRYVQVKLRFSDIKGMCAFVARFDSCEIEKMEDVFRDVLQGKVNMYNDRYSNIINRYSMIGN